MFYTFATKNLPQLYSKLQKVYMHLIFYSITSIPEENVHFQLPKEEVYGLVPAISLSIIIQLFVEWILQ